MSAMFRRSDEVMTAPLDDKLLMLSIQKGKYYNLNGAGPRIWELLEHPTSEEALVDALFAEYDVTREVCAEQVAAFLAALRERGLLAEA